MTKKQLLEKMAVYESLLHSLHMVSSVAMNKEKTTKLLENISRWSYAHRMGNGQFSEKEQDDLVKKAFDKLLEY